MAYISKITLPSGSSYDIKDAEAREQIAALAGGDAVVFVGVSSTALTDGGTEIPTISGKQKNPEVGQLFFYGTEEFIWGNDNNWHALGSLESLGSLAYKNDATTTYTPEGSVSQPDFTGDASDVTFSITDDSSGNYQPAGDISGGTFTGSSTTFTGTFTPQGDVTTTVKTSTNQTTTVSKANSGAATYTPEGSVSQPTFDGDELTSTGTFTPSGEVNLTRSNKTATVGTTEGEATYTPAGSVSTPNITVKTAGATSTIHNPTSVTVAKTVVAAAPGATAPTNSLVYYAVSEETLSLYQLGYTTGESITTSDINVKTGDAAYESSQPTFTGTGARLITDNISTIDSASFSGTQGNVSVTGEPTDTVSQPTFTGTGARLVTGDISVPSEFESSFSGTAGSVSTSGTPNGSNSALTFNGTTVRIEGETTARGTVSQPTFSGLEATITVS